MSNYTLKVNTGMVKVPVIDEDGEELGFIRFNPTDADIIKRYQEVAKYFMGLREEIGDEATVESLITVSDKVKEKLDFLFNSKVSETLFLKCSPFTMMEDGNFYLFVVMDAIEALISQIMDDRIAKLRKIEEATKEYN